MSMTGKGCLEIQVDVDKVKISFFPLLLYKQLNFALVRVTNHFLKMWSIVRNILTQPKMSLRVLLSIFIYLARNKILESIRILPG